MQSLYMAMMMSKSFFSIVFMFINQIFQLKSFGFNLLNAIINVGRFIIQYQQHVAAQQKKEVVKLQTHDWAGSTGYGYSSGNNYQYYQPSSYSSSSQSGNDRVTRMTSSATNDGNNNLHANNLAYSAYTSQNTGVRT